MPSGSVVQLRPTIGFASEQLTVSGTVNVLTPTVYHSGTESGGADRAFITVEDCSLRYRYDGTAPTSALGHKISDGSQIVLEGQNQIANFKFIQTGNFSGTIYVTYERE